MPSLSFNLCLRVKMGDIVPVYKGGGKDLLRMDIYRGIT